MYIHFLLLFTFLSFELNSCVQVSFRLQACLCPPYTYFLLLLHIRNISNHGPVHTYAAEVLSPPFLVFLVCFRWVAVSSQQQQLRKYMRRCQRGWFGYLDHNYGISKFFFRHSTFWPTCPRVCAGSPVLKVRPDISLIMIWSKFHPSHY